MKPTGYLVLESGQIFSGQWRGGQASAGEVVFNTSHSGYEEMATDPSYFSQILVLTAPMQGNYGETDGHWESSRIWISGFVCLQLQESSRDHSWQDKLNANRVPIVSDLDTRELVLLLREQGTTWGALLPAESEDQARREGEKIIQQSKDRDLDWAWQVSRTAPEEVTGQNPRGPKVAVIDFGCKNNTLRELQKRCRQLKIFPSRTSVEEIRKYDPDGIMLSNGPGNPEDVKLAAETVKQLLGWRFVFGICMGHQILAKSLGARTYRLKFGHRGSNHPIKDEILGQIYMTSQNHGYAVERDSLPDGVEITHTNLNDNTISGIQCLEKKCLSVQFHPESHPGPHDAENLFDYFVKQLQ